MRLRPILQRAFLVLGLATLLAFPGAAAPVRAAGPWYVAPGGSDANSCLSPAAPCATINGAIGKASPGDTIHVAEGTYSGAGDQVVLIDRNVTLSGGWSNSFAAQDGRSTVDGQGARRGITVSSGVNASVERFIVQHGDADCAGILNGPLYDGDLGTLTVSDSAIRNNTAGTTGGGLCNYYGNLTLIRSSVHDNAITGPGGYAGAGIFNFHGTVILENSTVSHNTSASNNGGGGIKNDPQGTVKLYNSTVSNNVAQEGGGFLTGGLVTLENSILTGNTTRGGAPSDCYGGFSSAGYNIIGSQSNCTFVAGPGDQIEVDPGLGPLIGHSDWPQYHPLRSGSPAIDAGNAAGCSGSAGPLTIDQRGASRVGQCDIGAYEYVSPGPPASIRPLSGAPQRTAPSTAFWFPLQSVVIDDAGTPVGGVAITFTAPVSGPSGVFATSGTRLVSVMADQGIATAPTFTANGLRGSYVIAADAAGVSIPASFELSNEGWYVASAEGDDGAACDTPAAPCATINGVLGKAGFVPGDTVLVAHGIYTGGGTEVVRLDERVRLLGGWDASFTTSDTYATIDGQDVRRGITVNSDMAQLEGFEIRNGYGNDAYGLAGGVVNYGTLTMQRCAVIGNRGYTGGGVYSGGILTLEACDIRENTADNSGGGVYGMRAVINNSSISNNANGGLEVNSLDLSNSTVSSNTWYGIVSDDFRLSSATVSGNLGIGVGPFWGYDVALVRNSIIAGNTGNGSSYDCSGGVESAGYNLIGDSRGCSFQPAIGDQLDIVPRLLSLAGSPGFHPLLPCSPAIDAGNPAGCFDYLGNPIATDQRGVSRPLDGDGDGTATCDIGAFEYDLNSDAGSCGYLPLVLRGY